MNAPRSVRSFTHARASFVAARTPALPLADWSRLFDGLETPSAHDDALEQTCARDASLLHERLRQRLRAPLVREALYVASPTLDEAVQVWLRDPAHPRASDVPATALRYLTRMATRATPFGLFASHSLGVPGERTRLAAPSALTRRVRLDMQYLCALVSSLERDPSLRDRLRFEPCNAAYESAGKIRYAEARIDPSTRARRNDTVSVEANEPLRAVLRDARGGATLRALGDRLVAGMGVEASEAQRYLGELLEAGLLVSELTPSLTGGDALATLITRLEGLAPEHPAVATLTSARDALGALAESPLGASPARYEAIAEALCALPCEVERARLFQVDLHGKGDAVAGEAVYRAVEHAVETLQAITPWREDPALVRFRDRFVARWEDAEVPLSMALDEERGLGFGDDAAGGLHPLLDGLALGASRATDRAEFCERSRWMLSRLQALSGEREWALDARDVEQLSTPGAAPLPDSFAAMVSVLGDDALSFEYAMGPSGARLLGRFACGDDALKERVEEHLKGEEALRPNAVFAEIVHLPQGRLGNIAARPRLRTWEIPYLGRAGVDDAHALTLDDLRVRVDPPSGRVVLRSVRLDREVVPRMTNAHNHAAAELPVYRFLCALAVQGVRGGLAWSWGALATAPFLPRVSLGRVVLSRAAWNLDARELSPLERQPTADRLRALRALRARLGIPRVVAAQEGDHVLPLDLESPLGVDVLAQLARGREGTLTLTETLDDLRAPDGLVHELVIPFLRRAPAPDVQPSRAPRRAPSAFAPGSEWLYAKVYTGALTADEVLTQVVGPCVRALRAQGVLRRWFFVRFADPEGHLRLRFQGDPAALCATLLPMLHAALAPWMRDGRVARLALDTYVRESERYGGDAQIERCEAVFEADSDAALRAIAMTKGDAGADLRWRVALSGAHALMNDVGLPRPARIELLETQRSRWAQQIGVDAAAEGQISKRFRAERPALESLLEGAPEEVHDLWRRRAEATRAHAGRFEPTVVASLLHMSINRMLRAAQNAHEVVIYDFLTRLYRSQEARRAGAR